MKGLVTLCAVLVAAALPTAASAQSISLDAPDQDCKALSPAARMIDSGALRVCQSEWNLASAYFGGHLARPLADSVAELHVALPDKQVTFAATCCDDATFPLFSDAVLDAAVGSTPFTGVSRYTAPGNLQIIETARVSAGASGYTLTYALTNTSGAPLKLRPLVDVSGYGTGAPTLTPAASPRSVTMTNPIEGGSVRLSESVVDGSPPAAGFTGGDYEDVIVYDDPDGDSLDDAVYPTYTGADTRIALAWSQTTLAAGATARYSVELAVTPAREIQLDLPSGQLVSDPVTKFNVKVTDERLAAGGLARLEVENGAGGSAPLAADGSGQLAITVPVGTSKLTAWFDADNDGTRDADEPETVGFTQLTYRPAPIFIPAPPAWNLPAPTPAAPSQTAVTVPFKATYKVKSCAGKTVQLRLKNGTTVLAKRNAKLDKRCRVKTSFKITLAQFRSPEKLRVELRYRGKAKTFKLP